MSSSLSRLEAALTDTRFTDDVRIATIDVLQNFPAFSDDAVEGAARFLSEAGDTLPLNTKKNLLSEIAAQDNADKFFQFIKSAPNSDVPQGIADLLQLAPCGVQP